MKVKDQLYWGIFYLGFFMLFQWIYNEPLSSWHICLYVLIALNNIEIVKLKERIKELEDWRDL